MSKIYQLIYLSELSEQARALDVGTIVKQSRINNAKLGITGILIFDGHRFCQCLEGDRDKVQQLLNTIMADPRHQHLIISHQDFSEEGRVFGSWSMAYALAEDESALTQLSNTQGRTCLLSLLKLIPELDMG